jgi:DNA-binding NtrC family response regulator
MSSTAKLLVVDDEKQIRVILQRLLADEGYQVETAESGEECLPRALELRPDLVLMDLSLPGMDGIETLAALQAQGVDAQVLLMTAYGSVESAVRAIKLGAYDYIEKPFDNDDLLNRIRHALEQRQLQTQVQDLQARLDGRYHPEGIVGVSGVMQVVLSQVTRAAQSDATVLVQGESGTGKELIVRALHQQSRRRDGPFVALNCAALPATLIENELFGHETGAFTDARQRYCGRFEQAGGGTLFLDEVAELPLEAQGKLLRVIQEREISRIGGTETIPVDVRLVASTNRDLESLTRSGGFREDLYYRLNVVAVHLPPLRERGEDIPLLVDFFLSRLHRVGEGRLEGVESQAMELFRRYPWPGNVRELENVLQGAAVMCRGPRIQPEDLPLRVQQQEVGGQAGEASKLAEVLAQVERRIITEALELEKHNRTRTAARLGITRKTLLAKITEYGLG